MNEAFPQTDRHRAKCDHFDAALPIARMPERIASGNSGHASITPANRGSSACVGKSRFSRSEVTGSEFIYEEVLRLSLWTL